MKNYLLIIAIYFVQWSVIADVIVPGGRINGDVWTKDNSPYRIIENVYIDDLIIEAGVEVLFDDDKIFQIDSILICNGFFNDSIIFKKSQINTVGWSGINFKNCNALSHLNYCRIVGSNEKGIEVDGELSPLLSNCSITGNQTNGIDLVRTSMSIVNCKINNNNNGIYLNDAIIEVYNTIISLNSGDGIFASDNRDSISVINSVIADNSRNGILSVSGYLRVTNSIIYYNNVEISAIPGNTIVTYSDIGDGSIYPGTGNINYDPLFEDRDNYYLLDLSPCIDQGHPPGSQYNDIYFPPSKGTSRNDMGAYGGPLAGYWFPPLFIQPDSLNFGQVSFGDSVTLTLNIKNYRDSTIVVRSADFSGNDTSVFSTDTDSLNIDVFDSAYINITFTPDGQDLFSAILEMETMKYGEFYVSVLGEGKIAQINILQDSLDFSMVDLGDSLELGVPILNSGSDTLRLFNIFTTDKYFSVRDSILNIHPNHSIDTVFVTFTPDSIDRKIDSLVILSNDHDEGRITIPLFGQGFGPLIILNSSSYDFGSVFLTFDSTLSTSISNNGNNSLLVDSIQIIENDSKTFSILNDTLNYPIIIEPDSTFYFDIQFIPKVLGGDSAQLVIQNNDVFNPIVSKPLLGYGIAPVIGLNQTNINFGVIPFNTSAVDSIIIKNTGNYFLIIEEDSLTFSGNDLEFFNIDSLSSSQIDSGDSAIMFISFDADSEGVKQAALQVVSNDPENTKIFVQLSGESWAPQISVSNPELDFGDILKDSVSYLSTYIYNNGQGDLILFEDSLNISGNDSGYFQIDSVSKYSINYTDSAFITIQFSAIKTGNNSAILNIINNDPLQKNVQIDLSAFVLVPFINLSHSFIDFGSIPLLSKEIKSLIIYNQGYEPLTVYLDSLEIIGTDSQYFSIDSILSDSTIQPNDSAEIILGFSATDEGIKSASLKIASDDRILPLLTVALTGSSNTPQIGLSSSNLDFGIVPAASDTTFALVVRNTGQGNLILYKEGLLFRGIDSLSFYIDVLDSNIVVNPQDSIEFSVGLYTNMVGPKSATLQIQSNDFNDSILNINLSGLVIDNMPASVSLDQSHSNQELIYKQNGNLRFIISTNFSADSVLLNYRQGGADVFNTVHCTDLAQMNLWEVTIDSSWITQKGFEYFVRVFHGWRETDWPEKAKSLQVIINKMEFSEPTSKEVYQKISIPFNTSNQTLNELFGDNLGSYDNTNYRIYDCENGVDYTEITNLDKELPPGKSLWLITKDEVRLDFTNAKTVHTDSTFKLSLKSGWNMIATPFAFPINWDDNDPNHELRFYDGTNDWPAVSVMDPYKGYAVEVDSATVVHIYPKEYTGTTNLVKQSLFTEYNWTIKLKVDQNKYRDHYNFAGTKNNAQEGIDRYDFSEPPPIGNFVALYFIQHNKITGKTKKFSTDIKNESMDGYIYNFEIKGNITGKKNLTIETNSLPEDYRYVVVNPESKIKYGAGSIELYSNNNKLQLIVGPEEYVNAHTVDYNFVPVNFSLAQNYPNPFNPSTIIKYQLPSFTKISIDVYNILGQKVKSLINNETKDAGYYQVRWDGKNNSGNTVATGIYFLNFRSYQFSKSIKMLLQR